MIYSFIFTINFYIEDRIGLEMPSKGNSSILFNLYLKLKVIILKGLVAVIENAWFLLKRASLWQGFDMRLLYLCKGFILQLYFEMCQNL